MASLVPVLLALILAAILDREGTAKFLAPLVLLAALAGLSFFALSGYVLVTKFVAWFIESVPSDAQFVLLMIAIFAVAAGLAIHAYRLFWGWIDRLYERRTPVLEFFWLRWTPSTGQEPGVT
jgi:peptidoglycan/LPS O-acetylase OafA/YrhL